MPDSPTVPNELLEAIREAALIELGDEPLDGSLIRKRSPDESRRRTVGRSFTMTPTGR